MRLSKTDYIKLVYNIRIILNFIPHASNIMKNTNIDLLRASPWVGPGFISTSPDKRIHNFNKHKMIVILMTLSSKNLASFTKF